MAAFGGWETAVLDAIGAPLTQSNIAFLDAWQAAEGGAAAFNPLNTTQPAAGASAYNSNGGNPVKNYLSAAQGVAATVKTLTNGNYGTIVAGLQAGDPYASQFSSGISSELQTWGTGAAFYAKGVTNGGGFGSAFTPSDTTSSAPTAVVPFALSAQASSYIIIVIGVTLFIIAAAAYV